MTDLERFGFIQAGEVETVISEILDEMNMGKPDMLEMMQTGIRVNLMSTGMYLINRSEIGELRCKKDTHTIIEILTIEELYQFMDDYYEYVESGQSSALRSIMVYKLEEKMDDIYEDNYDLIFKEYIKQGEQF